MQTPFPSLRLKVCGMREPRNIVEISALQPDLMGFIFYEKSPRYAGNISPQTLASLSRHIKKVGVFVDTSLLFIKEKVTQYDLNILQLHGKESPEFCKEIKEMTQCQIIKVFGIDNNFDFERLEAYRQIADFFLFDTQTISHGGSGKRFSWDILGRYNLPKPYFLSGGIGVEHSQEIKTLHQTQPYLYGIDINSRFENQPGIKNVSLIKTFIKQLRQI